MIPRHVLLRLIGLLSLACAIVGCKGGSPVAELPPAPVSVSHPVVREVVDFDAYEGRVAAIRKVEIRTQARGYLLAVKFEDGEIVQGPEKDRPGALLFEIDPATYEASLEAAKAQEKAADANLDFAKSEYARVKKLVARDAASREEMEVWTAKQFIAKADKLKAQVSIRQAEIDLAYTKVKAPFTGRVSRTQVKEGTLINSGGGDTLLTTLVSVGPVYVYFNVDERAMLRYRRGRGKPDAKGNLPSVASLKIPLHVALDGEDGYPHLGVVDYADPKVDAGTGTIEIRGVVPNKSGLFQDGMRARIRVPIGEPRKAILITERAINNEQGRKFVWVVNEDKVAKRRDVTLGRLFDGLQEVESGLSEKDLVIVSGIQRVRDQAVVKPTEEPMPDAWPAKAPQKDPEKPKE